MPVIYWFNLEWILMDCTYAVVNILESKKFISAMLNDLSPLGSL